MDNRPHFIPNIPRPTLLVYIVTPLFLLTMNQQPNDFARINRLPVRFKPAPSQTPPMNSTALPPSSTPPPQPDLLLLPPTDPHAHPPGWSTWDRYKRKSFKVTTTNENSIPLKQTKTMRENYKPGLAGPSVFSLFHFPASKF